MCVFKTLKWQCVLHCTVMIENPAICQTATVTPFSVIKFFFVLSIFFCIWLTDEYKGSFWFFFARAEAVLIIYNSTLAMWFFCIPCFKMNLALNKLSIILPRLCFLWKSQNSFKQKLTPPEVLWRWMMIKNMEQRALSWLYKTTGFQNTFSSGTFPDNLGFKERIVYMSVSAQVIASIYHPFFLCLAYFLASDTKC